MDRHYRALVIGGGVVGCNVLYHLTREGWSEVALCERRELTAGATWHSSGHISAYTGDLALVELAQYTRSQIDRLRTEVEHDLGLRSAGSLRLATRPAHLEEYRRFARVAQTVGVDARVIGPREALAVWPLMNDEGVLGALHLPGDCYLSDRAWSGARIDRSPTATSAVCTRRASISWSTSASASRSTRGESASSRPADG